MSTWEKGHNKGQIARNRKLPPDAVIRAAYYDEGLTIAEIAARHGIEPNNIHGLFLLRGWPKRDRAPSGGTTRELCATAAKVITRRMGYQHGRSTTLVEFMISLPRIPTLHGHFQEA